MGLIEAQKHTLSNVPVRPTTVLMTNLALVEKEKKLKCINASSINMIIVPPVNLFIFKSTLLDFIPRLLRVLYYNCIF